MVEAYPLVIKHGTMENTSLNAAAPETGGSTLTHTDLQGGSAGESWKIGATEPLANLGISWIPCDSEMMLPWISWILYGIFSKHKTTFPIGLVCQAPEMHWKHVHLPSEILFVGGCPPYIDHGTGRKGPKNKFVGGQLLWVVVAARGVQARNARLLEADLSFSTGGGSRVEPLSPGRTRLLPTKIWVDIPEISNMEHVIKQQNWD
jgi:hypothetical protein